jgi:spore cortex formation protein SpoVR/YcgB (stage V sporulation)
MNDFLWTDSEWSFKQLERVTQEIEKIATDELGLDPYLPQIEIITSEQMVDAYSSIGLPIFYKHWSFGKHFTQNWNSYQKGIQNLAYEIVINCSPCIAYLMEENTMTMQALVIAHACLSGDTEFLTSTGWKRIDQYDGELVGQYHEDGRVTFVKPQEYIKRDQSDFIYIASEKISQAITDDHTVVVINQHGTLMKLTGQEFAKRQASKTRGVDCKFITGFNIDHDRSLDLSDDEIRLYIAIKADGNIVNPDVDKTHFAAKPHYRIRFHLKKERKITRLKDLLTRLGIVYYENPSYDGRVFIHFNYHLIDKRYTSKWYDASPDQLRIIGEEVCYWDGSCGPPNDSFSSAHKEDAEFIQYVWAATGNHAHMRWVQRAYQVIKSEKILVGLSKHGGDGRTPAQPFSRVPSEDGHAYCFTVDTGMLIIRHANKISVTGNCFGHSHFFKNNYLFKQWTDAESIIDYLVFARDYIDKCEAREGRDKVEQFLDSCHALQNYGVNRYKRPGKLSAVKEKARSEAREQYKQSKVNELFDTLVKEEKENPDKVKPFPEQPEENILYFCEKYAPDLPEWKREIIRIVRKISEYFLPQGQTKIMNEGCLVAGSLITTNEGLLPIEKIVKQRMTISVWDGSTWQKVYDWFEHTDKPRIKLTTKHGYIIHGGVDHKILVNGDWKTLNEIEVDDDLPINVSDVKTTTKVISKEHDVGTTYDFSVANTHQYASGPFIHHNCATYSHYRILNRLHEKGLMTDGAFQEFLISHTNVVFQPEFDDPRYSGINPYALGFAMMCDIERICKEPTEEDRRWFPDIAGCHDEMTVLRNAWANYRDESFIRQFLSPKLIRDFRLFRLEDKKDDPHYTVTAIHDDKGYEKVRESLADSYERHASVPQIEVIRVDPQTRTLTLKYYRYRDRTLDKTTTLIKHVQALWGHVVNLRDEADNLIA